MGDSIVCEQPLETEDAFVFRGALGWGGVPATISVGQKQW